MIRAILTDIEGTTSSISFVKDVLFPYSRERMMSFVAHHAADPDVAKLLHEARTLCGMELSTEAVAEQLIRWIDEDRKAPPLKALQGMIWEDGYRNGDYCGHIYEDAMRKLKEWKAQGIDLYVFSSGSVHAQKLLFGHTEYGDLTPLFSGYFDTRIGPKQEEASYRTIARQIGLPPASILFLSDIVGELDAAKSAGFLTCQLVREGTDLDPSAYNRAANFDTISISS
ncbi:HAD superfamily hydrolase [Methylocaldum marinum]|uniref:Enolase-phosphatase E1 n=1 Tax=Methylocaldum marinum TaxID=1432792 RepID=A0A250KS12_9GAMM|nr:acireductone synthase [Methylocaldum marinum]BBA34455.1 HAD superfamily hydrolase [Methylocaldum marinum]